MHETYVYSFKCGQSDAYITRNWREKNLLPFYFLHLIYLSFYWYFYLFICLFIYLFIYIYIYFFLGGGGGDVYKILVCQCACEGFSTPFPPPPPPNYTNNLNSFMKIIPKKLKFDVCKLFIAFSYICTCSDTQFGDLYLQIAHS